MNQNSMREALKRRKLGALDITILLGDNSGVLPTNGDLNAVADNEVKEDKDDTEELDLAPRGSNVGEAEEGEDLAMSHGDEEADKLLIEQELAKHGLTGGTMVGRNMKKTKALSTNEV